MANVSDGIARSELERALGRQEYVQAPSVAVTEMMRLHCEFLPPYWRPCSAFNGRVNDGTISRVYLGPEAEDSPSTVSRVLKNMPSEGWAYCSDPLVRLLLVSGNGTGVYDAAYVNKKDDPRRRPPDFVSAAGVAVDVKCLRPVSGAKDEFYRLAATGKALRETRARYAAAHRAVLGTEPTVFLAVVFNDDTGQGKVRFVNLDEYLERAGTKSTDPLVRGGGSVFAASVADEWLTPAAMGTLLAKAYASVYPSLEQGLRTLVRLRDEGQLRVVGGHVLRLEPRSSTGQDGFGPAAYHHATGGLLVRSWVAGAVRDAADAVRGVGDRVGAVDDVVRDWCARESSPSLEYVPRARAFPTLTVGVPAFTSAYQGEYVDHPSSFVFPEHVADAPTVTVNGQYLGLVRPGMVRVDPVFPMSDPLAEYIDGLPTWEYLLGAGDS